MMSSVFQSSISCDFQEELSAEPQMDIISKGNFMSDCQRYTGVKPRPSKCTMNVNDIPKLEKADEQRTVTHVNRHIINGRCNGVLDIQD